MKTGRLLINSDKYPEKLREIRNPPKELYYAGNIDLIEEVSVAVVGSRKYSIYGKQIAEMIGERLGECGVTVISGLASGIDTFAHKGVIKNKGKAVAVLGTGLGKCYPASNRIIMSEIAEKGLLLSEYPSDFQGTKYSFPARNRIISGISKSIIVVEAGSSSGALITAEFGNEQGRNIYAVPGNINSHYSLGCNLLIRDGARPLIIIDDIMKDLNIECMDETIKNVELGRDEEAVMDVIMKRSGTTVDFISHKINKKPSQINAILTLLEIKGLIISYAGKIYVAK